VPEDRPDRRARILVILPDVAWPLDGGKRLRSAGVLSGLAQVGEVDLAVLFSTAEDDGAPCPPDIEVARWLRLSPPPLPLAAAGLRLVVDGVPWQVAAQRWETVRHELAQWTAGRDYDLVWFGAMDHALSLADAVRARHSLVDMDDIETEKWRAYLERPATGWSQRLEHLQRRIELPLWGRAQRRVAAQHGVVLCSDQDRERMLAAGARQALVVPNTYPDPGLVDRVIAEEAPELLFVGNYAVAANVDAAEHLVRDVLPLLRASVPTVQVRLVGREGHRVGHLAGLAGVDLVGEVDDVRPYLASATVVVAPVRFGGGTRLKLLEAFAAGVPVVSTPLGAMGLGARDGVHLLLGEDAGQLAAAVGRLCSHPQLGRQLAEAARELYVDRFTPAAAISAVRRAVDPLLLQGSGAGDASLPTGAAADELASFDVFDTVLTRTCGSPRQVFLLTGGRLHEAGTISADAHAYAAAREEALSDLTADVARHPPLARVMDEVASRLGLPGGTVDELVETELAVERAVCRAVPGAPERIARARRRSDRGVLFISDTPLPEPFVRELLVREGLFCDGDRLFVSAECGASKQEGGLFDVVARSMQTSSARIRHVGDDRWSDVAHARLHGWGADLDTGAKLTSRERRLDDAAATTGGVGARLAGASRMGRLAAQSDGTDPDLAAIAGSVALPVLAGLGQWVLQQARLLELDRLYFLARDGEVLLEVTRRLAEHAHDPVECLYLRGSRRSWQLASTGTADYDRASGLWVPDGLSGEDFTPRGMLSLVGLPVDDAVGIAPSVLSAGQLDQPLGAEGWARMRAALLDGPLAATVDARNRERRDLMIRYLVQEGLTAPGRVGLVDVGWTGRMVRSLEDVLVDGGLPLPAAYLFLGLRRTAPALMGPDLFARSRGWLIDEARGRGVRTRPDEDPVMVFESFAMGSEGHTTGYTVVGNRVEASLAAPVNPSASRWDLIGYRRTLSRALDTLLDGPPLDDGVDLRPLVWAQVLDFWRRPTRDEATVWGGQPYTEDFANASPYPLATPATGRRVLSRLRMGPASWRKPTYWLAGTIEMSPQPWRTLLRLAAWGRWEARRLPRIPARLRGELAMRRPTDR